MANEIQEDCIGIVINPQLVNSTTNLPLDLTTANVITFRFLAPYIGAVVVEKTGNVTGDPTQGNVFYANDSDEFFDVGNWKYQVKVTFSSGQIWYSSISKIKVKANL